MAIDTTTPTSRRALLVGLAGGLAATVASSLGRPLPASAHDPDDVRLGGSNSATTVTSISNTVNDNTLLAVESDGAGTGLAAISSSGNAVTGSSTSGTGVYGTSDHIGVYGTSNYIGVYAFSDSGNAVYALGGSGTAVFASNNSATLPATRAWSGRNTGLQGHSGAGFPPASPIKTGVFGSATQAGGRGGQFSGKAAQIRLRPSTATTHPASGAAGDLFLDASKRLWLCKGGSSWARLDT